MRAMFEEFEHGWVAEWHGEIAQEAIGPETAADFLIVEDDPAPSFPAARPRRAAGISQSAQRGKRGSRRIG